MGFIRVIEPVGDFTAMVGIVRVAQLQCVGNEINLLLFVQQCHFAFDLLKTYNCILALNRFGARLTS